MICNRCGTQSNSNFCSYCGAPLYREAGMSPMPPSPRIVPLAGGERGTEIRPPQSLSPVAEEWRTEGEAASLPEKKRKRRREVSFGVIMMPAIALCLPVIYLFVELFARLNEALLAGDNFSLLYGRLSSAEFVNFPVRELIAATYGGDGELYQVFSAASLFGGGAGEMMLPVLTVFVFSVLSALVAILLFFSGGQLLRFRLFTDLTVFAGVGAAFSPLLGLFLMRLSYLFSGGTAAADAAMARVTLSVESAILVLLSALLVLPAVSMLASTGARVAHDRYHIQFPFRFLGGTSFGAVRVLAAVFGGGVLILSLLQLFLPVLPFGGLAFFSAAWDAGFSDRISLAKALVNSFAGGIGAIDFPALAGTLLYALFYLQIPLLLAALVAYAFSYVRLFFVKKETLSNRKCDYRAMKKMGVRGRRPVMMLFWSMTALQAVLVLFMLFCSPLAGHMDMADVEGTRTLIYLSIGYIRNICSVTTLYCLLAFGGSLFWHLSNAMAWRLVDISAEADPAPVVDTE